MAQTVAQMQEEFDRDAPDLTYDFLRGIDGTSLHRPGHIEIPQATLNGMTNMVRDYWMIKKDHFDVVIFFKKGAFYELYDCDAVISKQLFGLKMSGGDPDGKQGNRGSMRMTGVPEKAYSEWSRQFIFKGFKVGRVEQMVVDDAMRAANSGKDPKVIPRELRIIMTRGTVTESNAIEGAEPVYIMAVVPVINHTADGNQQQQNIEAVAENCSFDVIAVDLSRQIYNYCPCDNFSELVTLMHHLQPKELLVPALDPRQATNVVLATAASKDKQQQQQQQQFTPEEAAVAHATKQLEAIVGDILSECTIERISSPQASALALAAARHAIEAHKGSKGSSGDQPQLFGSSGFLSGGSSSSLLGGGGSAASTAAGSGDNTASVANNSSLPMSWHLVYEYFRYLKLDGDRLLPKKFVFEGGNGDEGISADDAPAVKQEPGSNVPAAAVKQEKAAVDDDEDDEDALLFGGGGNNSKKKNNQNSNNNDDDQDAALSTRQVVFRLYSLHKKVQTDSQPLTMAAAAARAASSDKSKKLKILSLERRYDPGLALDAAAIETLDLVINSRDGTSANTILSWLVGERQRMPGAARMLRQWILRPSCNAAVISARQGAVRLLLDAPNELQPLLQGWERLMEKKKGGGGAVAAAAAAAMRAGGNNDDDDEDDDDNAGGGAKAGGKRPADCAPVVQANVSVASVDFERLLSRISDFKSEDTRVSNVDPLVHYPKNCQHIHHVLKGMEHLLDFERVASNAVNNFVLRQQQQNNGNNNGDNNAEAAKLLRELLGDIAQARGAVEQTLAKFPRDKIARDGQLLPNPGENPAFDTSEKQLRDATATLDDYLAKARRNLDSKCKWSHIGKDQYLLEVPLASAKPAALTKAGYPAGEFAERAKTTKVAKLSVKSLEKTVADHKRATTARQLAIVQTLREVASFMCQRFHIFYTAAHAAGYLDCLFGLSAAASQQQCMGSVCFPKFVSSGDEARDSNSCSVELREAYHPLILLLRSKCVPNSVVLGATQNGGGGGGGRQQQQQQQQQQQRTLILSGPNASGKSSFMRTVAVNIILSQIGGAVCAAGMTVTGSPVDRVFTRIGAQDSTHRGQSTLFVELTETATILREATGRSLCLLDELGRGTSTHDGYAIAHASIRDLAGLGAAGTPRSGAPEQQLPLVLFATHYHALALEVSLIEAARQRIQLAYMDFTSGGRRQRTSADVVESSNMLRVKQEGAPATGNQPQPQQEDNVTVRTDIEFLYRLVPGICARSYGAEVALQVGLPRHLVEKARGVARQMALVSSDHQLVDFKKFLEKQPQQAQEQQQGETLEQVKSRATQLLALANAATAAAQ